MGKTFPQLTCYAVWVPPWGGPLACYLCPKRYWLWEPSYYTSQRLTTSSLATPWLVWRCCWNTHQKPGNATTKTRGNWHQTAFDLCLTASPEQTWKLAEQESRPGFPRGPSHLDLQCEASTEDNTRMSWSLEHHAPHLADTAQGLCTTKLPQARQVQRDWKSGEYA